MTNGKKILTVTLFAIGILILENIDWINEHCYKNHAAFEAMASNSGPLCR